MTRTVQVIGMVLLTGNVSFIIIGIITMSSPSNSSPSHEAYHYEPIVFGAGISNLTTVAFLVKTAARLLVVSSPAHLAAGQLLSDDIQRSDSYSHLLKAGHSLFSPGGSSVTDLNGKLAAPAESNK